MIVWSIDAAEGVSEICDILVSTDDPTIADVARTAGALVPWLRPAVLASNTATTVDAAVHALDWYEAERGAVDALLILQPTSPFRSTETIKQGIEKFQANATESVVGVSPTHAHPDWTFTIMNGRLVPFLNKKGLGKRSQDLVPAYIVNGAFYLISTDAIRVERTLFPDGSVPLEIHSTKEALDIDDEWDFKFAEFMVATVDL
jgi:CMP-N,N'-diacetyllegionaminic acid synthase